VPIPRPQVQPAAMAQDDTIPPLMEIPTQSAPLSIIQRRNQVIAQLVALYPTLNPVELIDEPLDFLEGMLYNMQQYEAGLFGPPEDEMWE
jgi:hypothetical protein